MQASDPPSGGERGESVRPGFPISRRAVLRGGALMVAVFAPLAGGGGSAIGVPVGESGGPGFLTEHELRTLRAVVDRIVPEDRDAGGVTAGCAEAIDALLGAFRVDPPRIYAGAPFSDRAGSPVNHFEEFLPLDAYETMAWRLRVEGSRGESRLERNGPVKGFQATYRDGLAALDEAAGEGGFAEMSAPERDVVLRTAADPLIKALMDIAVVHTLEFMYGAPEYGGNAAVVAWQYAQYDGDVQPRGWTREQVEQRDHDGLPGVGLPALPVAVSRDELLIAMAAALPETISGLTARADGVLSGLREQIGGIVAGTLKGSHDDW